MNLFKSNSGQTFSSSDVYTESDKDFIDQMGGNVRWCPDCNIYDSPNSPCNCGSYVIMMGDKYWGRDEENNGGEWVSERYRAISFIIGEKQELSDLVEILRATYGGTVHAKKWGNKTMYVKCDFCGTKHDWYHAPKGKTVECSKRTLWACGSLPCHNMASVDRNHPYSWGKKF